MAYNQYFPQSYPPYGYSPYQAQIMANQQNFQQPQQIQQAPQQIQNGGFVSVRSIEEAYNYPVAPGNSITFKVENAPYVCTKTKGFSQLDQPVFEKYRLVKEEEQQTIPEQAVRPVEAKNYDDDIKLLWNEIDAIKDQIGSLKPQSKKAVKKEVDLNENSSDSK